MCWACNPVCGRCKPPKQKVATCPSCGAVAFFSKGEILSAESLPCPKCGEELLGMVEPYNTPAAKPGEHDQLE